MEFSERVGILIQAAELAQKSGILTLDEACNAKSAIDICNSQNGDIDSALNLLIHIAEKGQRNGIYTLKDAYFIYLATGNE